MENIMGKSIDIILKDSTITLWNVLNDSTEFRFFFGRESHLTHLFLKENISGNPTMVVGVDKSKIQEIYFTFTSAGDFTTEYEIIHSILQDHFCIENLKKDEENRFSHCNYEKGDVNIEVKYFWDAGIMDIIRIKYSFI